MELCDSHFSFRAVPLRVGIWAGVDTPSFLRLRGSGDVRGVVFFTRPRRTPLERLHDGLGASGFSGHGSMDEDAALWMDPPRGRQRGTAGLCRARSVFLLRGACRGGLRARPAGFESGQADAGGAGARCDLSDRVRSCGGANFAGNECGGGIRSRRRDSLSPGLSDNFRAGGSGAAATFGT